MGYGKEFKEGIVVSSIYRKSVSTIYISYVEYTCTEAHVAVSFEPSVHERNPVSFDGAIGATSMSVTGY